MKKTFLLLLAVLSILQSCTKEEKKEVTLPSKTVMQITSEYYAERMKLFPMESTTAGDTIYNNLLPNSLSDAYIKEAKAFFTKYKNATENLSVELSENDRLSIELLKWECDINLEQLSFKENLLPLNQFTSQILTIGQWGSGAGAQPFKTVKDYNNWLKRLAQFNTYLVSVENRMKEGVAKGYVLPKALTEKMIPQLKDMANENVTSHLLYSPVEQFPDLFTETEKKVLTDKFTTILKNKIIPSFKSLYNYVSTDYLKASRTTSGISGITNGAAYYKHLIKRYTTTDMTAEEIHALGLKEIARLSAEMEKVKTQVGFKGPLKDFFNYVRAKKELMPFTHPQQVIDNFNAIHEKMKPNLEKLFDMKPKTPFEVRRTEAFREASASAEYNQGSVDGTRPGIFYVPIPDVKKYNVYADEDLFLHEAIPGHHYQISIQQENKDLPDFRKTIWFNAYGEGWALYTESLGKELGLYTDPYQYFGMLSAEMHRALRLVVDTGLHTKGWTREQAIKYSMENEAEPEESIIAEIERYMAIPGQALSYKIGQLKIRELRTKAEKKLGAKFSIKEFHNQVLDAGCLPLKVLEGKIDKWIESKK